MATRWTPILAVLLAASCSSCSGSKDAPFFTEANAAEGPEAPADGTPSTPPTQADAGRAASAQPTGCKGGPELRVLYIGNSHTFVNDLPSLVRELACQAGTRIVSQQSTPGGVGFIEHSTNPDTLAKIAADAWDVVVLQDQQQRPSFEPQAVDKNDVPPLRTLVDAIAKNRTSTRRLFYMVYGRNGGDAPNCAKFPPLCSFEGQTRTIEQGYRLHVDRTGGEIAPVALAFAEAHGDPKLPLATPSDLWAPDGYHPNLATSYLAAAVIVGKMLGGTTAPLTYTAGLPEATATYLRIVADRWVKHESDDPYVKTHEAVSMYCWGPCPPSADGAEVSFRLSRDGCAALRSGSAKLAGRIDTTLLCNDTVCATVPLGSWHEVPGAVIADGSYQVLAHVDLNHNGKLDTGDLQACETDKLVVGSGSSIVLKSFSMQ